MSAITDSYKIAVLLLLTQLAYAACDCASTDANAPCTGQSISSTVNVDRSINFTWAFNSGGSDARCGQFANGDYWIAPAVGQSSVTITSIGTTGSGAISADVNPSIDGYGLLDGTNSYYSYDSNENIVPNLPINYSTDVSIVAAVKKDEVAHGVCGTSSIEGECVDAYSIVTVLSAVPAKAGSETLRPAIVPTVKEQITYDDLVFDRIPQYAFLTGTDAAGLETIRQRWSHTTEIFGVKFLTYPNPTTNPASEGGRAFRADSVVPEYGAGTAQQWFNDLMIILSDDNTITAKKPAIAAMLTYGKDIFNAVYDGNFTQITSWGSGAGQSLGRYPPAVFFAAVSKNAAYGNTLRTLPDITGQSNRQAPHELEQLNDGPNGPVWGDIEDTYSLLDLSSYWGGLFKGQCYDGAPGVCAPNQGDKTKRDPYNLIDGPQAKPGTNYMVTTAGPFRSFAASLILMKGACYYVHYPELLQYVDRIAAHGIQTGSDTCAPPDPLENDPTVCLPYPNNGTGCKYYGLNHTESTPTWGPDPNDLTQCITNGAGQNGRFSALDGTALSSYGYTSSQVENNWSTIRALAGASCEIAKPKAPSNTGAVQQ